MSTSQFIFNLTLAVLGIGLTIPFNIFIVIVNLESLGRKEKLSPSDVIFLFKGTVNVLLQGLLSLQGMFFAFSPAVLFTGGKYSLYSFLKVAIYFQMYFSFWLTAWLSIHYFTSITNLSHGFFIWLKGIVSNFLRQILFLTAFGIFIVNVLGIWALNIEGNSKCSVNRTAEASYGIYHPSYSYFVPSTFLGCVLPFCLSLLCLVLAFSFLLRHVWRVKTNDSGSTRPNLQAHLTALRTIFFLLFIFTSFFMSRVILVIKRPSESSDPIAMVFWTFLASFPSVEAAIIFQASNKLKRVILRRFRTKSWRSTDT